MTPSEFQKNSIPFLQQIAEDWDYLSRNRQHKYFSMRLEKLQNRIDFHKAAEKYFAGMRELMGELAGQEYELMAEREMWRSTGNQAAVAMEIYQVLLPELGESMAALRQKAEDAVMLNQIKGIKPDPVGRAIKYYQETGDRALIDAISANYNSDKRLTKYINKPLTEKENAN